MKVPVYERKVTPGSLPSPDVSPRVNPDAFGAGFAEKLGELGNAAQRAGNLLGQVALKQQEEVNAMDFALLKAKADAWWDEQMEQESMNTDYEGMNARLTKGWEGFRKELEDGISNEAVKQKASQYFEIKSVSQQGEVQGLFLKKQALVRRGKFDEAVAAAVRAGKKEDVDAIIAAALSWLPETDAVKIREKAYTDMQYDAAVKGIVADPLGWKADRKAFDRLDEVTFQKLLDFQDSKQREIRNKVSEWVAMQVLSGKPPSKGDLLGLAQKGMLDPDRALSWATAIESRQEMLANRAERNAERAFRTRLRNAPPDEKELLLLEYNFGTSPTESKAAFESLRKGLLEGTKDGYDIMDANGAGLIGERQRNRLMKEFNEITGRRNANYTKAKNLARSELKSILESVEIDPYDLLVQFDEAVDPSMTPLEQIREVRNYLLRKAVTDDKKGRFFFNPFGQKAKILEQTAGAVWFPPQLGGVEDGGLKAPTVQAGPDKSSSAGAKVEKSRKQRLQDALYGNE